MDELCPPDRLYRPDGSCPCGGSGLSVRPAVVENVVSGTVHGPSVQAGVIIGGVHHHDHAPDRSAVALAALRGQVHDQWQREAGLRGLAQPKPLRLRWRTAPGRLRSRNASLVEGALAHDVHDVRPAAHQLVDAISDDPHRQFVLLGAPGAGKSTLAVLYALAAVELTRTVPVLLSVAGWNPAEPVRDWFLRRTTEDYPGHSPEVLVRLLADGLVVPVLDGLDEMPGRLLGRALDELEASGLHLLLTCRTEEFEQAVEAAGHTMAAASVAHVEPVDPDDVATFLSQGEDAEVDRWTDLLDHLREAPAGPLASALSTPLMISLARRVYRRPANPLGLLRHETADEVRDHLVADYLPAVYPGRREQRWLAFLAHHLKEHQRQPDYEWWLLVRAVPRIALTVPLMAVLLLVGAVVGACVELVVPFNMSVPPGFVFGALGGLAVGIVAAVRAVRVAKPAGARRTGWSEAPRDAVTALAVLAGVSVVMVSISFAFDPKWTRYILSELRHDLPVPVLLPVLTVIAAAALTHGLSGSRDHLPHRSRPAWARLPEAMGGRVGVVARIGVLTVLADLPFRTGALSILGGGAVVLAFVVGLNRWVSAPASEETATSPSPEPVLRADRNVMLTSAVACGLVATTLAWLWAYLSGELNLARSGDLRTSWVFSVALGLFVAFGVIAGSASTWLTYTLARLWLAASGRLPLRLSRFLRDAHRTGVLRGTGPTYQFRHLVLRDHLADRFTASRRDR